MRVEIESRYPLNLTVDAAEFGRLFASMKADEQVAVLQEIVDAMRPWQTQWDHIAIELENPEHQDLIRNLRSIISGMEVML